MPLFHSSCNLYEEGQLLPVREEPSSFHNSSVEAGQGWINDGLELGALENSPIRSRAYYAFNCLEHCLSYTNSITCPDGELYFYEVGLENERNAPMILTKLMNIIGQGSPSLDGVIKEYWERTKDWKFIEYLGDSMRIIRRIEVPLGLDKILLSNKGKFDYEHDDELLKIFRIELEELND